MKPIPHAPCPQCGELRTVTNKLLATNLHRGEQYAEAFEVTDPQKFDSSPFTRDDYFVDALFCRSCGIAFIPDGVALEMGIGRNTFRGSRKASRPVGLGAYDDRVVRPFHAIVWTKDGAPGVRVEVLAHSVEEARSKLESEHGMGTVFDLHNDDDASRLR